MRTPIDDKSAINISKTDDMDLKEITTVINLTGSLNAMFVMSFEENLARYLVKQFVIDELTGEEEIEYIEDTVAEISNIILGNTIKVITDLTGPVAFESPVTIHTAEASCIYPAIDIWDCSLTTGYGDISLSFLVNNPVMENDK
jgi:CheY-specific phosphatase CheX